MSGHSRWSQIKRKKGKADVQRGKLFSKILREITVAEADGAKHGAVGRALDPFGDGAAAGVQWHGSGELEAGAGNREWWKGNRIGRRTPDRGRAPLLRGQGPWSLGSCLPLVVEPGCVALVAVYEVSLNSCIFCTK